MSHPFITIVVPTYSRYQEFAVTVDSLQSQIFKDFDVVVVDDTPEEEKDQRLIKTYCRDFENMTYVHRTLVGGPSRPVASARSCGAAMAQGEVVLWLDQDFLLHSCFLESVARVHSFIGDCIVIPNVVMSNLKAEDVPNSDLAVKDSFFRYFKAREASYWSTSENPILSYKVSGSPGCSVRRQTFMKYDLWDVRFPGYATEDVDFAAACMKAELKSVHVSDAMGIHLYHSVERYTPEMWHQAREAFYTKWGYYPRNPIDPFKSREELKEEGE